MKIIVKKILKVSDIPKKDGSGSFQKTQFLSSEDEIVSVFGTTQEGAELEGDLMDTQWGKELKLSRTSGGGFKKGGFSADPDTMLISYGKDVIVAFINAGIIKDSAAALAGLDAFTGKFFAIYNSKKNGAAKPVETKKVEKDIDTTRQDEEEINLDDVPSE